MPGSSTAQIRHGPGRCGRQWQSASGRPSIPSQSSGRSISRRIPVRVAAHPRAATRSWPARWGTPGSFQRVWCIVMITGHPEWLQTSYYYPSRPRAACSPNLQAINTWTAGGDSSEVGRMALPGTNFFGRARPGTPTPARLLLAAPRPSMPPGAGPAQTVCLVERLAAAGTPQPPTRSAGRQTANGRTSSACSCRPAREPTSSHVEWLTYDGIVTDAVGRDQRAASSSALNGFASDHRQWRPQTGRRAHPDDRHPVPGPARRSCRSRPRSGSAATGSAPGTWYHHRLCDASVVAYTVDHARHAQPDSRGVRHLLRRHPRRRRRRRRGQHQHHASRGADDGALWGHRWLPVGRGAWELVQTARTSTSASATPCRSAFQARGVDRATPTSSCMQRHLLERRRPHARTSSSAASAWTEPRGYLPRLDLWSDPSATATPVNANPAVFFGSLDPRPNRAGGRCLGHVRT